MAELELLLPSIMEFENRNFKLPELDLVKVIKLEMKMRDEIPLFLKNIFGSEENVLLFLSGKKGITHTILKALCKRYRIGFLYAEFYKKLLS